MTPWRPTRWAATRGAFARSSSAASGFFFCGMIEEPDAQASATSQKPNSSLDHSEAELGGKQAAVRVEVDPGQRARAQWQLLRRAEHEVEAAGVAPEHPEV